MPSIRGMLTLGDSYTSGDFFNSIGFRGVQIATDDRMLPDSLNGYAPVVRGVAQSNALVEIRQNNQLIYQTTVAPGEFIINDLYPTGYGGDLNVTINEADGSKRQFSVPYASVAQMLRPCIQRYAITAGRVRDDNLSKEPDMFGRLISAVLPTLLRDTQVGSSVMAMAQCWWAARLRHRSAHLRST